MAADVREGSSRGTVWFLGQATLQAAGMLGIQEWWRGRLSQHLSTLVMLSGFTCRYLGLFGMFLGGIAGSGAQSQFCSSGGFYEQQRVLRTSELKSTFFPSNPTNLWAPLTGRSGRDRHTFWLPCQKNLPIPLLKQACFKQFSGASLSDVKWERDLILALHHSWGLSTLKPAWDQRGLVGS